MSPQLKSIHSINYALYDPLAFKSKQKKMYITTFNEIAFPAKLFMKNDLVKLWQKMLFH